MPMAILDDYSRLCCHLQLYLAETAECLVHGLTQAFMKRGLPRALLTDNGAAMLAEETRNGLSRLAIEHKTTLPYSPYQNGKQEVFWGQLESRLIELLRGIDNLRLSFVNRAAQAWVEQDYHHRRHREIQTTPLARLLGGPDVSRPARFGHLHQVTLRAPSWDKSQMSLVDADTDAPLARLLPIDKAKNASGRRRVICADNPDLQPPADPMPALLRKWLAEYAQTGLPPAYLPKEEITP